MRGGEEREGREQKGGGKALKKVDQSQDGGSKQAEETGDEISDT